MRAIYQCTCVTLKMYNLKCRLWTSISHPLTNKKHSKSFYILIQNFISCNRHLNSRQIQNSSIRFESLLNSNKFSQDAASATNLSNLIIQYDAHNADDLLSKSCTQRIPKHFSTYTI